MEAAHTSILNILIAYGALQACFIALILFRSFKECEQMSPSEYLATIKK